MSIEVRLNTLSEELKTLVGEISTKTVTRESGPRILNTVSNILDSCEAIESFFDDDNEIDMEYFEKDH